MRRLDPRQETVNRKPDGRPAGGLWQNHSPHRWDAMVTREPSRRRPWRIPQGQARQQAGKPHRR
jgi:hypothetical protein